MTKEAGFVAADFLKRQILAGKVFLENYFGALAYPVV